MSLLKPYVDKFQFAPFPYFGGKRTVTSDVWQRLGRPIQYIEPFCGSAAMLLTAPSIASLEVIGDQNLYVANFWRCIKFQPEETYRWQDYPVSHVDLDARHRWLTDPQRTSALLADLSDPEWPGNPQIAGWWVWGQCCWIGSGWCERDSQIPHVSDAGMGVRDWFQHLALRLERVRIIHGDWSRCLNHHYGGKDTAIFFDPPYKNFERLYHSDTTALIADQVVLWCQDNAEGIRVALCGYVGDYDLPGWEVFRWSRGRSTYGGSDTTENEAIWFSPACLLGNQHLFDFTE